MTQLLYLQVIAVYAVYFDGLTTIFMLNNGFVISIFSFLRY